MKPRLSITSMLLVALVAGATGAIPAEGVGGVKISLPGYQGPATVRAESLGRFKLRVDVNAHGETKPLAVGVELPNSGSNTWPSADVEVRSADGKALLVQRSGIEWFKMLIRLPAGAASCIVQAVEPAGGWPRSTSEKERAIQDDVSGVKMRIAQWHDGRAAALSLRFDDSHPTHLTKVVPILREYGYRGTFMICPGGPEPGGRHVSNFDQHRAGWESVAKEGDQEFANHSAHHRGGFGDEDMEAEVREAAMAIWQLTPGRSKLTALNLGGGTRWETTRPLRYYLDKYHHFDASENSTGMDDSYGNRVENFRRILDQHLQRGLWCRIHYHYIGDGLSSSEANFRAALDIVKQRQSDLWIAGMAEIHKYQSERNAARLALLKSGTQKLGFRMTCATDPVLYDQPLTIEVVPPAAWSLEKVVITDAQGNILSAKPGKVQAAAALRFDVPPREGEYTIGRGP